jgi:uncharacterized protein (TIGR02646 family)
VRQITKLPEPASLIAHRQTAHSNFGNYQGKPELRANLVQEQGALCCYCMQRIYVDGRSMKIEHWRSQDNYPQEQLTYLNLLGGCKGGEGNPLAVQHCDTRKGEADLQWNPADPAHHIETRIRYGLDGTIASGDEVFNDQLNRVLNLNLTLIKNNRKGVLTGLLDWFRRERSRLKGPIPRVNIERQVEQWTRAANDLPPYGQVAVWWLQQKLAGMD